MRKILSMLLSAMLYAAVIVGYPANTTSEIVKPAKSNVEETIDFGAEGEASELAYPYVSDPEPNDF